MTKQAPKLVEMTFEEYADGYEHLSTLFDEQYWGGGFNSEKAYDCVVRAAASEGVIITDLETADYDSILYSIYDATEKGLS